MGTTSGMDFLLRSNRWCPGDHAGFSSRAPCARRCGAVGQRLPAGRVLAEDLGISRRLVVEVYTQPSAEGYLVSRPGSGTCVSGLSLPPTIEVSDALRSAEVVPR
ncbi:GntR family transcriptional regulator [Amycolatopsis sp. NPDC023774]|uniref:GntR family transcriptional regulator n=1 Tax=Amycolatopsis sp. NPDC023774 TaxID=3155015 RepID=UPI0033F7946B